MHHYYFNLSYFIISFINGGQTSQYQSYHQSSSSHSQLYQEQVRPSARSDLKETDERLDF